MASRFILILSPPTLSPSPSPSVSPSLPSLSLSSLLLLTLSFPLSLSEVNPQFLTNQNELYLDATPHSSVTHFSSPSPTLQLINRAAESLLYKYSPLSSSTLLFVETLLLFAQLSLASPSRHSASLISSPSHHLKALSHRVERARR